MPEKALQSIIAAGESMTVEFKRSFDNAVIETISAFANTAGGVVIVGVGDDGKITGVDIGKETLQEWQNNIKTATAPFLLPEISKHTIEGKTVVAIEIQEMPVKPVACRGRYFNPGRLPEGLTVSKLLGGEYVSTPRNKQIASIFKEAGIIEKYGSGIRRIRLAMVEAENPEPIFEEIGEGFRVTLLKALLQITPPITPPMKNRRVALDDKIISVIQKSPEAMKRDIANALGIAVSTVKEYLTKLKKQGRIKWVGTTRKGRWEILKKE